MKKGGKGKMGGEGRMGREDGNIGKGKVKGDRLLLWALGLRLWALGLQL